MLGGFLHAVIAAVSFGLIPLLASPLTGTLPTELLLFYRFFLTCLLVCVFVLCSGEKLAASRGDIWKLFLLSFLHCSSDILYFMGIQHMPGGLAATIFYIYPVIVAVLSVFFLQERLSPITCAAILLTAAGVAILSLDNTSRPISMRGPMLMLGSALACACYLVGIARIHLHDMSGFKATFYIFLFGSIFMLIFTVSQGALTLPDNKNTYLQLLLLALVTGAISNICTILAIQRIGTTITAICGSLEPLTAVCVGVIVFGEPMTIPIAMGISLIVTAVLMIIPGTPSRTAGK